MENKKIEKTGRKTLHHNGEPDFGSPTKFEGLLGRGDDEEYSDYKERRRRESYNLSKRKKGKYVHVSKYKKDGKTYGSGVYHAKKDS